VPLEHDVTGKATGGSSRLELNRSAHVPLLHTDAEKATAARIYYNRGQADRPFAEKEDALIPLAAFLTSDKRGSPHSLVRDTPVVADWNGGGKADLAVFGYISTGVRGSGAPAVYLWLQ
jgi:hypothetical protein